MVKEGLIQDFDPDQSTAKIGADGVTDNTDVRVRHKVDVMPPVFLEEQPDLPSGFKVSVQKTDEVLGQLEEDQKAAEGMGLMRIEDYHKIQKEQAQAQLDRDLKLRTMEVRSGELRGEP